MTRTDLESVVTAAFIARVGFLRDANVSTPIDTTATEVRDLLTKLQRAEVAKSIAAKRALRG